MSSVAAGRRSGAVTEGLGASTAQTTGRGSRSSAAGPHHTREWSARLPQPLTLGPFRLAVEWRAPVAMLDPRARGCLNLRAGRIELRQDQTGLVLAEAFFGCLVQLSQARRLGRGAALHESAAHRLATGLVEFALRNPAIWLWFNLLLSHHLPGAPQFDRALRGALAQPPAMPPTIVVAGTELKLVRAAAPLPAAPASADGRHLYVDPRLRGTALPVAALDAITEALHRAWALDPDAPPSRLRRAERRGWLAIMRDNPAVWRWLVWSISVPQRASRARR